MELNKKINLRTTGKRIIIASIVFVFLELLIITFLLSPSMIFALNNFYNSVMNNQEGLIGLWITLMLIFLMLELVICLLVLIILNERKKNRTI